MWIESDVDSPLVATEVLRDFWDDSNTSVFGFLSRVRIDEACGLNDYEQNNTNFTENKLKDPLKAIGALDTE